MLYLGRFLAENILSINLKIHFLQWRVGHYGTLPLMNRSILMYYLKLTSYIQLKNQKIKTLNVSSVMENSPKMKEDKYGLSVLAAVLFGCTWIEPVQRTQITSVTFINRLKADVIFA